MLSLTSEDIKRQARGVGLKLVGISSPTILKDDEFKLRKWQERGYAAKMNYMYRDPSMLSNPFRLFPETKSILSFAVSYGVQPHPPLPEGFGRVSRYAWGKDYHKVLKKRLICFVKHFEQKFGSSIRYRIFTDAVPFLERAQSVSAGLGFIGKNTMLIRPRMGSFFFLAEVFWNVHVEYNRNSFPIVGKCGKCSRCLDACPTGAFPSCYVLDANKCISYLTIEKRGAFTDKEKRDIGQWVFGCDICQEVCPFNHLPSRVGAKPDIDEFGSDFGVGPVLDLNMVLSIDNDSLFLQRFSGTPLMRAGRQGLLRNAACVAANTKALNTVPSLLNYGIVDRSPIIRDASIWSAGQLYPFTTGLWKKRVKLSVEKALKDSDNLCASQARNVLEKM